ncbi:hypothetical protein IWX90DRAFT_444823 [Phyllosticta citrichinensis]|uniref:Uncharacterized protein n=1 Tax=Phyllosticta citrichinensis TaxID=1130410 RepID=A0ABR1XGE4_9PEZI
MAWGRGGAGNYEAQEEQSKKVAENIASQHRRASRTGSIVPIRTTTSPPLPFAHSGRGGAGNTYSPAELAQTGTFQSTVNASSSARDAAVGEYVVPAGTPSSSTTAAAFTTETATAEPPPRELSDLDTQSKWYNTATPHTSNGSSTHPPPAPANQHTSSTAPSSSSSSSPAEVPLARTGRGGAGNFVWSSSSSPSSSSPSSTNANTAAATPTQAAQLQRSVLADVERGLARPNRAWLGPGPGPGSPPPAAGTAPPALNGVGEKGLDKERGDGDAGVQVKTSPPRKVAARKGSWVGAAVTGHGHGVRHDHPSA